MQNLTNPLADAHTSTMTVYGYARLDKLGFAQVETIGDNA